MKIILIMLTILVVLLYISILCLWKYIQNYEKQVSISFKECKEVELRLKTIIENIIDIEKDNKVILEKICNIINSKIIK